MTIGKPEKLSASLEDYLEAIYHLSADSSVARGKDIAELLGVRHASVTGALRSLAQKDLIHYQPYGYVTLTGRGRQLAKRVAGRHRVLESFFVDILGLDPELSKDAACKAEHALGSEIISRLTLFLEFFGQSGGRVGESGESFKAYYRSHSGVLYQEGTGTGNHDGSEK